jgi:flagellin
MALNSINTNIGSYYAQSNIGRANDMASSSIARLSSGNRIVKASDDVASMSAGTSLQTNVTTLRVAQLNTDQGSSLLQVADGALAQVTDILQRQAAIATQASSGSLTASERGFLDQEFQALTQEIDRLATGTNFNGVELLDGTLGSSSQLAATDAISATLGAAGLIATASTVAIEAFFDNGANAGASAGNNTVPAAAGGAGQGNLAFVDNADTGTAAALADSDFQGVNPSVYGEVGPFEMSDFVANVSARLTTTINGVEFSGTVAATSNNFILSNGNTNISFGVNTAFSLADEGVAQTELLAANNDFADVSIAQTRQVTGVDVAGTSLAGVTGNAASGIAMLRTYDPENSGISNFRFVTPATGANVIAVDVGDTTYTANNVPDNVAAGTVLSFSDGNGQALQIDLTGLTTGFTDIFTSETDRNNFINGLNQAFSSATGGVDFAVGNSSADTLTVSIGNSTTTNLYGGQALNVNSVTAANEAIDVLNTAIDRVTSLRADVGALQSRFDFAAANIDSSIQNQDAARGVLLDTDIASESTSFSQSQVQLQAGISVLAQANLLPQNLLKLIG